MNEPATTQPQVTPRVYIFSGNDTVGKDAAKEKAVRAVASCTSTLVKEHFDPATESFAEYLQRIMMPTLFAEERIFSINHAESLAESELDELDRLLAGLPGDVYIVVDIGDAGKRKGAKADPVKRLHAAERGKKEPDRFVYRDFIKPPDYKVAQWLLENVPDLCGRSIDKAAADLLVDLAGYDIAALFSEVRKIDIHLEEKQPIDSRAVEAIVGSSRQMTVFELAAACGARQAVRVLEIIDSLFSTAVSVPMVISVLYRHYGALFRIRNYARKQPQDVKMLLKAGGGGYQAKNEAAFRIGRAAGLLREGDERKVYPVMIASGIVAQAQQYTDQELETVFSWLLEFDVAVKTGRMTGSRREVELFCYRLLRVATVQPAVDGA